LFEVIPISSRGPHFPYTTLFRSDEPCRLHEVPDTGLTALAHERVEPLSFRGRLSLCEPDPLDGDPLLDVAGGQRLIEEVVESKRSEEHTSELQSPCNLVCRLLPE